MTKALVVIDVQKYFMDKNTIKIPDKITSYIKKNRDKFDQIVFFKFINNENTPFYRFYDWKDMMDPPGTDLCPEIEDIKHKPFTKSTRSCLRNKDFHEFLRKNKIEELYLCGFNTEECVLATAHDAFDCGFKVFIIKDLCSSHYGKEAHENAMRIIKEQFEVV